VRRTILPSIKLIPLYLLLLVLPRVSLAADDLVPGLVGEYFTYKTNGYVPDLPAGAKPFLVRVDKQINFPDPGTGGDFHGTKLVYNFAVRWTGVLRVAKAGEYTLSTQSDDGARLTVDGKVVLENDGPHPLSEKSAKIQLTSGDHPMKLEFAQGGGGSAVMLYWHPAGGDKHLVPGEALFHSKATEAVAWDQEAWAKFQLGGGAKGQAAAKRDNSPWGRMDYGPFLSHTIGSPQPSNNVTLKGVAIKLDNGNAGVLFDTALLRYSAAWTGGFLKLQGVAFDGAHGPNPEIGGTFRFGTSNGPGWAKPGTTDFTDPRPRPFGTLPTEWAHYRGLYRNGNQVVLSYTVGATEVLEAPGIEGNGDAVLFSRTFQVGASKESMTLAVGEIDGAGEGAAVNDLLNGTFKQPAEAFGTVGITKSGDRLLMAACLLDEPEKFEALLKELREAKWETVVKNNRTRLLLTLPPRTDVWRFSLFVADGTKKFDLVQLLDNRKHADIASLIKGGPALWPETVETKGKLADTRSGDAAKAAYVVDTLTIPEKNPYNSWLRFGGFDFFPDGKSAAVCTWSGDVWVVSGIDDKLEKLTWKRFAAGLFQPLGLKIVDGKIYVHGRDQITRLHDLNNDGEADFYENFNNDVKVTPGFHEFAFDLHTDPQGNFYFIKAGPVNPGGGGFGVTTEHNGSLMRVTKDGSRLDVIATGFRAPNGIGVGPHGEITTGDNQGTWTPVCRLNWIKPGGFYGVVDLAHRDKPPTQTDNPLCWLPYAWDNSSGSQVWAPEGNKWGPFGGDLLHLSYGKCKLFKVLIDKSNAGEIQGGVVRFPLKFDTGVMRGRFNPADGQLYVCGLRGWQTDAAQDAALQRVRYTGKPVNMPTGLRVKPDGIEVTFTSALKEELANDPGSFSVEQWNYHWTGEYGSDEYSANNPSKKGHDTLEVTSAKLMPDGKTVFLAIAGLKPVMQMVIKYDLESADGTQVADEVALTINAVGDKRLVVSSKGD
jgi:hypothetical protein